MDSNHRYLDVSQGSSPLDHGIQTPWGGFPIRPKPDGLENSPTILRVAGVGVEPTINHQALDLAALPVCVPGRIGSRLLSLVFLSPCLLVSLSRGIARV